MNSTDAEINLKKRIIAARKNVRKKFSMLKLNDYDVNADVRKVMNPIIEPLEKISKNIQLPTTTSQPVTSIHHQPAKHFIPPVSSTPIPSRSRLKSFLQTLTSPSQAPSSSSSSSSLPAFDDAESIAQESEPGARADASNLTFNSESSLLHQVRNLMQKSGDTEYDMTYGPKVKEGKLILGTTPVEIKQKTSDIYIEGERFKATPGLYELIFLKHPMNYTNIDLRKYKQLLHLTNVARDGYTSSGRLIASRAYKYVNIIRPMLNPRSGSGMKYLQYTGKPVEYKFWDDPNELVDRLVLLHASLRAGNTSCANEILAVEEELREANIIY